MAGDAIVCEHLVRQPAPMSGHDLCGQLGHGLAGLWHGIACVAADRVDVMPGLATAWVGGAIGTMMLTPSMATMPRTADQRWSRRRFTLVKLP
jgi:hypothetical protein